MAGMATMPWHIHNAQAGNRGFFMPGKNDRYVVKQGDRWAVKKAGVAAPESTHQKQSAAEKTAKATVRDLGGGEVRIQGRDHRWRDSDTVAPGHDPSPPRDKKH